MDDGPLLNTEIEIFLNGTDEVISNKKITRIEIYDKKISSKKVFSNCEITDGFTLYKSVIADELVFDNCTFKKGKLKKSKISSISGKGMFFRNCIFEDEIQFQFCTNENIEIYNSEINSIQVKDCNNQFFFIHEGIKENKAIKSIVINSNNISSFAIRDVNIRELGFNKVIPDSVFIGNGNYELIRFSNVKDFKTLIINGIDNFDHDLFIKDIRFDFVDLTGKILIKNVIFNRLSFGSLNNISGKFKVLKTVFKVLVRIPDSTLVDVMFNDVNFKNAKLILDRSFIDKALFANINWPDGYEVITEEELSETTEKKNQESISKIKKEVYRQLKNNCKNNSNTIDALKFYRQEMNEFWKYVRISKTESRATRFLLYISKTFSDFGQDYIRPILYMLLFHLILFMVIFIFGGFDFSFSSEQNCVTFKSISNGIGEYFRLLNPAHSTNENTVGLLIIIDVLMRIANGFFIYQIIRATRKYAKI